MLFLLTGQVPPEASERENLRTPLPLPPPRLAPHAGRHREADATSPRGPACQRAGSAPPPARHGRGRARSLRASNKRRLLLSRRTRPRGLPPRVPSGVRLSSGWRASPPASVMAATGLLWQVRPSVVPPRALPLRRPPLVGLTHGRDRRGTATGSAPLPPRRPATPPRSWECPAGDTVEVQHESTRKQVRLFDIDSPDQGQAHGDASRAELSRLALGRTVGIAVMKDQGRIRQDGRLRPRSRTAPT